MVTERVAIVGIGGVFPGSSGLDDFWDIILNTKDTATDVGVDRWNIIPNEIYSKQKSSDKIISKRACLIQNFNFDHKDLNVDPKLLSSLDPAYQILLHAGRDAWSSINTAPLNKERVGIIIGNIVLPTYSSSLFSDEILQNIFESQILKETKNNIKTEALNRYVAGLPAELLAKCLGLDGGAYTLDAACASSLYSLKYASDELLSGRCDAMLAGGLSRPDCLYTQMGFSQLNAISKSGRCSPFDEKADGLVVGEGCGVFVLKRLSDAIEHDDYIYATIEGIGLSNDIEGNIMSPNNDGQLRAMQQAYSKAAWLPNDVQHIECHGTGTLVGDEVEFSSLNKLWQGSDRQSKCIIGSVKSNVGHLLTAAGSAALMKTLLAIKHRVLPPTANFKNPSKNIDLKNSCFRVLSEAENWEVKNNGIRRAAISGFGFGGINAHVLLQEYSKDKHKASAVNFSRALVNSSSQKEQVIYNSDEQVAIVGVATQLGSWVNQDEFDRAVLSDHDNFEKYLAYEVGTNNNSVRRHLVENIKIALGRYNIPPNELKEMLPQQLLMLETAANAMDDAGLSNLSKEQSLRTGVFIGVELDLNTTNFHFRWMQKKYAPKWLKKLGVNLTDDELEKWVEQLRTSSGPALNANRTMGSLGGIVASRIARAFHIGGPAFTLSSEETSGLCGLISGVNALRQGELDQVIVGAVDFASEPRAVKGYLAYKKLDIVADGATAFILKRHEDAIKQGDKIYALINGTGFAGTQTNAIKGACLQARCELDSIDHVCIAAADKKMSLEGRKKQIVNHFPLGYTGAANGLMAVNMAVSLLKRRLILRDKHKVNYWLKNRIEGPRKSLVHSESIGGNHVSVILQEGNMEHSLKLEKKMFVLSAKDKENLIEKVNRLSFEDEALSYVKNEIFRIAFLAKDKIELDRACKEAIYSIEKNISIDDGKCFYSTESLCANGKLAFVYPGSGNHFFGMGQDLSGVFPQVLEKLHNENKRLASQFADGYFWQEHHSNKLKHKDVIFGQVWLGTFISDVVSSFDVKADAIIGYSLGETAGLFSTRTWTARDEMLERIEQSKLFTEQLAGSCLAAKKTWNIEHEIDWEVGVVVCFASKLKAAIKQLERVYILIINTQDECVIGGDKTQLCKLVKELNVPFHPLPYITTVHCDVVKPVAKEYRDLHLFDTTPPKNILFYSGFYAKTYKVDRDTAADSIVKQALNSFDYTKVIKNAYSDGVRLFIELGPGSSCTRMIDKILGGKPHYAKSLCVKEQSGVDNLLQILARIFVEGGAVNFSIFREQNTKPDSKYKKFIHIKNSEKIFKVPKPYIFRKTTLAPSSKQNNMEKAYVKDKNEYANSNITSLIKQMQKLEVAKFEAQESFLRVSESFAASIAKAVNIQKQFLAKNNIQLNTSSLIDNNDKKTPKNNYLFDRDMCMEFAIGSITNVLGDGFSDVEQHPTRVRLPDEPLMLVDRITFIEGEVGSMTSGRIITEHDVLSNAWYLDMGCVPTCIAVEAGQADLFLSAYLGIDHITKGKAVYRLLDAKVNFHSSLPKVGQTINYDIHIDHFFRQGDTWLFRFNFEAKIDNKPFLSMTNGCAGFFSEQELNAGRGIILTKIDKQDIAGKLTGNYKHLLPISIDSYSDEQLLALQDGDLVSCFGDIFSKLTFHDVAGLPKDRMRLVHRILKLDPAAGRYNLGQIIGEADIHFDDWFLTCHFVDDKVMPGTLMYECCLHTLRVYLLRIGWVGESKDFVYEPVCGEVSQLKCRGQVTEFTNKVQYEITIKEIGYKKDETPYVLADALMYADNKPIVQINNMSLQLTGLKHSKLEALWNNKNIINKKQAIFDNESIIAFAIGKPSLAFGDKYKIFDTERKIARLPGSPYKFLDRIVAIDNCKQWELKSGGVIEAEYDIPSDAWYFIEDNQPYMPFSVLLEIALQPCGWLAAYLGSALNSEIDISFRNLGGKAIQYMRLSPDSGFLNTKIKINNISKSGGIIIQNFDYTVTCSDKLVYKGDTYFGFFSKQALSEQLGIRDAKFYVPSEKELLNCVKNFPYPLKAPMPSTMMRMVDEISLYIPEGGVFGLGYIEGKVKVEKNAWFFKAHFYQDPVWPGSLGLESFIQLLKLFAWKRWQDKLTTGEFIFESMALSHQHEWIYRGQILPTDNEVKIWASIKKVDDMNMLVIADGFLSVDERIIYQMKDFALKIN